jgi:ATP-dependent Lon protease
MGFAEQNLYTRSTQLVGDKDPASTNSLSSCVPSIRPSRAWVSLPWSPSALHCTALLPRSVRGGLIIVGEINRDGSIEPIHKPVNIAEIAVEKGATALLMPVACRRQLLDLLDDMATKVDIQFYSYARDALIKAIAN